MKSIGETLFLMDPRSADGSPTRSHSRVSARDVGLKETWFRDAIARDPSIIVAPCRDAGRTSGDEEWFLWGVEVRLDAGPVDVLLVSNAGRVAVIETKLSYNPERRRTVVAQVMDYALALQDCGLDELPPLPDAAVDPTDVEDCLSTGRFLLVIAGDALDPRALRLSEGVLGRHLTSEWDLVMIDLNLYSATTRGHASLILVPEVRGMVAAEVRQVVRVDVDTGSGRSKVTVERIESPSSTSQARRDQLTAGGFFESLATNAPESTPHMRRLHEALARAQQDRPERFQFEAQTASMNLYVLVPTGRCRVIALRTDGKLRLISRYLTGRGFEELAQLLRRIAAETHPSLGEQPDVTVTVNALSLGMLEQLIDRVTEELDPRS